MTCIDGSLRGAVADYMRWPEFMSRAGSQMPTAVRMGLKPGSLDLCVNVTIVEHVSSHAYDSARSTNPAT